ncbi:glycosyltransferase family 4 protein [Desulfobulbus sp.]|uniref:glycosyltransferase family 4 protein n=1 Tax=Desulfobulbus sp. TaxID=895 RepID=UPI00286FA256|nr:glycosyltransferase family 4 protein [Desulfobulbus sp.]
MTHRSITWGKIKKGFLLLKSLVTQQNRKLFLHYLNRYLSEITSQNASVITRTSIQRFLLSAQAQHLFCRDRSGKPPSILFIFHELSLTGAPIVGVQLAQTLAKHYGLPPVILALRDGPLKDVLERVGMTVIIDENYLSAQRDLFCQELFCRHFDAIIVNSLASSIFLQNFASHGLPMAWWIHESAEGFRYAPPVFPRCFDMMRAVWWVSPNSEACGRRYVSEDKTAYLRYGVADRATTEKNAPLCSREIVFGLIGSFIRRKGQDILLSALAQLSSPVLERIRVIIVGEPYDPDGNPDYTKDILVKMRKFSNIDYRGTMSNDDCLKLLASLDVLICPSTDDPMPVVVTEALMCSKLCIISDAIGQAHLLNHEEAILIPAGSPEALADAITNIVNQPELIERFATPARAAYERFFSIEQFENNAIHLVDGLLNLKN